MLKGEPGQGKTTVFESIYWVLFGKLRNVGHQLLPKESQTSVILELDNLAGLGSDIVIYRQNHSNRLVLTIGQPVSNQGRQATEHEDQVAQNIIDQYFGQKNIWKSVSYIEQGGKCVLLSGSRQERLALLEALSFREDNPREAIQKFDQRLTVEQSNYKLSQARLETEISMFSKRLSERPLNPNFIFTPERLEQIKVEIESLSAELQAEEARKSEFFRLSGIQTHLQSDREQLRLQLQDIKFPNDIEQLLVEWQGSLSILETEQSEIESKITVQQEDELKWRNRLNQVLTQIGKLEEQRATLDRTAGALTELLKRNNVLNNQIAVYQPQLDKVRKSSLQSQIIHLHSVIDSLDQQIAAERLGQQEKCSQLEAKMAQCQREYQFTQQQIEQNKTEIDRITNQIDQLDAEIAAEVHKLIKLKSTISQIMQSVVKKEQELAPLPKVQDWPTEQMVGKIILIEEEIKKNSELAHKLDLEYSPEVDQERPRVDAALKIVQKEKDKLVVVNRVIMYRKQVRQLLTSFNIQLKLIRQINGPELSTLIVLNTRDDAQKLSTQLTEMTQPLSYRLREQESATLLLICPECGGSLRMENSHLKSDSREPASPRKINQLKTSLSEFDHLKNSLSALLAIWPVGSLIPDTNEEISDQEIMDKIHELNQRKNNLRGLRWISRPNMSSTIMQELVDFQKINIEKDQLSQQFTSQANIQQYRLDQKTRLETRSRQLTKDIEGFLKQEALLAETRSTLVAQDEELKNQLQLSKLPLLETERVQNIQNRYQCQSEINQIEQRQQQHQSLQDENIKLNQQIQQLQTQLASLGGVEENLITLSTERSELQIKLENLDLTQMKTKIVQFQTDINLLKNKCKEHQSKFKLQARLKDQLQELDIKINEVEDKLKVLEGNRADQIRIDIGFKQQEWLEVQRGIGLVKEQLELTTKQEQLLIAQGRLSALEDLKQRAVVIQYMQLQETINSINAAMNKIFGAVFDDDIEVELKLFKLVKANKEHKPQVNCEIRYKGMTYERPNELSGGEQNRLNLGMILALNLVSTSPVVLLDECIHFLNNRLKTRCIDAVRAIVNKGKTIIAISHDDNEANYDEIIRVSMDGEFDAEVDSPRMEITI